MIKMSQWARDKLASFCMFFAHSLFKLIGEMRLENCTSTKSHVMLELWPKCCLKTPKGRKIHPPPPPPATPKLKAKSGSATENAPLNACVCQMFPSKSQPRPQGSLLSCAGRIGTPGQFLLAVANKGINLQHGDFGSLGFAFDSAQCNRKSVICGLKIPSGQRSRSPSLTKRSRPLGTRLSKSQLFCIAIYNTFLFCFLEDISSCKLL